MRRLYSLILYFLIPLALLRLAWRGLRAPDYWRRWPERFGFFPAPARSGAIWVHAVSVGEFQAALPLIKALMARYPAALLVVTTTTPTGSVRVKAALGDAVFHVYAPYDLPGAVSRFLERIRPQVAVIMETELWPNLFHGCRQRGIPVILANARLSGRSAAGYRRIAGLTRQTLACITAIAAQGEADAQRLTSLGADAARVRVTGNIKFDIALPLDLDEQAAALRRDLGATRPVWIAASTHEGEDEVILAAHVLVRQRLPDALLMLVPRHPERFARVAQLARKQGYGVVLRSERRPCDHTAAVFIGDSMGELMLFYAAADAAFVGGSLIASGGHNMLEPAALGLPVITGPHTFNFAQIGQMLIEAGAARQVSDAQELAEVVIDYLHDANLRLSMGEKGRQIVAQNRGALEGLVEMIADHVSCASKDV